MKLSAFLYIVVLTIVTVNVSLAQNYKSSANKNYYSTNNKKQAIEKSLNLAKNKAKAAISKKIKESTSEDSWLKRVELELDVNSEGKPIYDLLTVQPLHISNSGKHTFFTQGRIAYGDGDKTTSNIGFGYRNLIMDEKLMLGLNTFYDREWSFEHERAGVGAELRSSAFQFNTNYYNAFSDWQTDSSDSGFEERAMDGYDFEIGSQLPYLPWVHVFAKKYYWQGLEDIDGETFSARLRPLRFLEVELGTSDDESNSRVNFAEIRVRLNWGTESYSKNKVFLAQIDNKAFRLNESMRDQTLSKVRRENDIRVEKRVRGAAVLVSVSRGN